MSDDPVITTALDRFKRSSEAYQPQRDREQADLAFQIPEKQWPDDVRLARGGQRVAGMVTTPRPMLSIPKLDQPIQLVLNQEKSAQLGVQIHALSEKADDDTAEVIQGLYRRIEVDSRANLARSWAFERAVKAGLGVYRILTEYAKDGGETRDQNIVIKRILFQESVYLDPSAEEPDWSDGQWAFIAKWMLWETYKLERAKRKGKTSDGKETESDSEVANYDDGEFGAMVTDRPDWFKDDDGGKSVLLVEYFAIEHGKVIWRILNGCEVLEEQEWPGQYIPIVPVVGRELIPVDGKRVWMGIIGPNKDAQRMFNYAASNAVEIAALEPKAPWMMVEGQDEGHEAEFDLSNVRNFSRLRYRNVSFNGTSAPAPARVQIDASRLGPSMMLLQQADQFLHSGTGAFEPTLGQDTGGKSSGRKVMALQQQHDQGNSNWLDSLAEISLTREAVIVLDLIPKIYDRPGRVVRILDIEDNKESVMLNQPYVEHPETKQPMAMQQGPDGQMVPPPGAKPTDIKHWDFTRATYGVTVSIGKAYKSRLEEGNDALAQIFQADPEAFKLLGDIWMNFQTWPWHQQAAERMKKMLPPQLQDEQDQQDAGKQLEQAKAQLQQMQQQMQEMGKALETDKVKVDGQIQVAKISADKDLALQTMRDATTIAVAQINASTKIGIQQTEARNEAMALGLEHAQAEHDRKHELAMAMMGHEQGLEAGQQDVQGQSALSDQQAGQAADLAAQGHQQALEQGEQGQAHALEQGQQAADLAPAPAEGE